MRLYDGVTFGIERNGTDRRPVSSVARPARRVEVAGVDVQGVPCSQNRVIVACMALSRTDVTNSAMAVIDVVPLHKAGGPCACLVKVSKALGGELTWAAGF